MTYEEAYTLEKYFDKWLLKTRKLNKKYKNVTKR